MPDVAAARLAAAEAAAAIQQRVADKMVALQAIEKKDAKARTCNTLFFVKE
jgi:hypothetical protein